LATKEGQSEAVIPKIQLPVVLKAHLSHRIFLLSFKVFTVESIVTGIRYYSFFDLAISMPVRLTLFPMTAVITI